MITVVSEATGQPLGTLQRGKPRKGDNVFVEGASYEVVDYDKDTVFVRQQVQFEFPRRRSPQQYNDNGPVSRMSGFSGRRNPFEKHLPFKKYTDAPVYPTELSRPYTPPDPRARQGMPHWGIPPVSEGVFPYQAPKVFHVVHYRYYIPLYTVEHMHEPRVGQVENLAGEQYTYMKIDGDTIFVRPIRSWNYAVIALDKTTGSPLIFVPITHKSEISNTKFRVNQYLQKQQDTPRSVYHLKAVPLAKVTRYMRNAGGNLPRHRAS